MQKITPFLWFDNNAEDAVNFYISIFKNSKMGTVSRYSEEAAKASGRPKGSLMTASFQLNGQEFIALNGGPVFKFTEAISFVITCENQEEVDYYWEKLSAVPQSEQCGWCKDQYGLSWQISPTIMGSMMGNGSQEQLDRLTQTFLKMKKIDIKKLTRAFEGEPATANNE